MPPKNMQPGVVAPRAERLQPTPPTQSRRPLPEQLAKQPRPDAERAPIQAQRQRQPQSQTQASRSPQPQSQACKFTGIPASSRLATLAGGYEVDEDDPSLIYGTHSYVQEDIHESETDALPAYQEEQYQEELEEQYEEPIRQPTSVRRYNRPLQQEVWNQSTVRHSQQQIPERASSRDHERNHTRERYIDVPTTALVRRPPSTNLRFAAPPRQREQYASAPRRQSSIRRHSLLYVGIGMFLLIIVYTLVTQTMYWTHYLQARIAEGPHPTMIVQKDIGNHGGTSTFTISNYNGVITLEENTAGNKSDHKYIVTTMVGPNAAMDQVSLRFVNLLNRKGYLDIVVLCTTLNGDVVNQWQFYNTGSKGTGLSQLQP